MVSIDTMHKQINVRLPEQMLAFAQAYSKKHGFGTIQDLIKETLREKLFDEPKLSSQELKLVRRLAEISEKNNLYGTEEELFKKLG